MNNTIQWFPGHMAAAMRGLAARMPLVDVVIDVVDARLPLASSNPALDELAGRRARITVLSHDDVADPFVTKRWIAFYTGENRRAIALNSKEQQSVSRLKALLSETTAGGKGLSRAIIVGIPNTGKSSVINGLLKRGAAKTEDRAGVTRSLQWFRVGPSLELMDTPGLLVPKIATADAQWQLAVCGSIPRERYDPEEVALRFHAWVAQRDAQTKVPSLEDFARARGFVRRGDEADLHNAARGYIKAFNDGKFGRLSFEVPPAQNPPASAA